MKFALSEKEIEFLNTVLNDENNIERTTYDVRCSLLQKLKTVKEEAEKNDVFVFLTAGD